jgi:hypothetical protein
MLGRHARRGLSTGLVAAVLGCTGPSPAAEFSPQVEAAPQVRTVLFPEVGDPEGRATVEFFGGHEPLEVHCPRVEGSGGCRVGARPGQHWAQDGKSLWLVCEREVVRVDLRSEAREVVYRPDIGEREIDDLRAGGGQLAVAFNGSARAIANMKLDIWADYLEPGGDPEPPESEPDELRFALIDQQGRELWTLTSWRTPAFDIDADGRFLAVIDRDFDAITLRSLDDGVSYRLVGHAVDLAFVGDYLLTVGGYGPDYRLIDPDAGAVVSIVVVPRATTRRGAR